MFFKSVLVSLALVLGLAQSVVAENSSGPFQLPADGFGQAGFGARQSITSKVLEEARRDGLFEDTIDIRSGWIDRIAQITGRLDVLTNAVDEFGRPVAWACTGTAITDRLVLTNAHCVVPEDSLRPTSIRFLPNYRDSRRAVAVVAYSVELLPVERGTKDALDYAILRLEKPIVGYAPFAFQSRDPGPGGPLVLIGHPEGQPLHLTRARCAADREVPIDGNDIVHGCATRPGSSGSLVFSSEGWVVGLHFWGGGILGGREVNRAVRFAALLQESAVLRDAFKVQEETTSAEICAIISLPQGFECIADGLGGVAISARKGEEAIEVLPERMEADRKECDAGVPEGCSSLGLSFVNGIGVEQDQSRAAELFSKACDGGSMVACYNLGLQYAHGLGVVRDQANAVMLYTRACDGELMDGCNNLGVQYGTGQGVSLDFARALTLYAKACDGGVMLACNNLGLQYALGEGTAEDDVRALELLAKACDGGIEPACGSIKRLQP